MPTVPPSGPTWQYGTAPAGGHPPEARPSPGGGRAPTLLLVGIGLVVAFLAAFVGVRALVGGDGEDDGRLATGDERSQSDRDDTTGSGDRRDEADGAAEGTTPDGSATDGATPGVSEPGGTTDGGDRGPAPGTRPLRGWVSVVYSDFKDVITRDEAAAQAAGRPGSQVIDTDDFRTGDGQPPDYHPRGGVWAVVHGPFATLADAEAWCEANQPGACNPRQLVP